MTNPIESAQSARDAAQTALDSALASGDDVTDARQRLADAEAAIVGLQEAQREAEQAEQLAIEQDADALVEQARTETGEIVEKILSAIAGPPALAEIDRSYALILAAAKRRHEQAAGALHDADERLNALTSRLDDLQAERTAIVGRRSRGDCRDTDRGDVELIAIDTEGVTAALTRAQAERDRLASVARETRENLSQSERLIAADRERAIQQTLRDSQPPLEAALVEIAEQFKRHSALTGAHWWLTNVSLKNLTQAR